MCVCKTCERNGIHSTVNVWVCSVCHLGVCFCRVLCLLWHDVDVLKQPCAVDGVDVCLGLTQVVHTRRLGKETDTYPRTDRAHKHTHFEGGCKWRLFFQRGGAHNCHKICLAQECVHMVYSIKSFTVRMPTTTPCTLHRALKQASLLQCTERVGGWMDG